MRGTRKNKITARFHARLYTPIKILAIKKRFSGQARMTTGFCRGEYVHVREIESPY